MVSLERTLSWGSFLGSKTDLASTLGELRFRLSDGGGGGHILMTVIDRLCHYFSVPEQGDRQFLNQ